DPIAAERLHTRQVQTAFGLAAEELQQHVLGGGLALRELGEAAVAHELHGLAIDVERGDLVAEPGVVTQAQLSPELDELVDPVLEIAGVADPEHPPLVAERSLGDRPTPVELAEEVLAGHDDV